MRKKFDFLKNLDNLVTQTPVSEIMVKDIKTLDESDSVQKAIDMMAQYSISGILIKNGNGFPSGIISEGDILKKVFHTKEDPKKVKIKDIMTKNLFTINPGKNIGETAELMRRHGISKLPVVQNEKLVGYVTKSDLLEKLNEIYYQNSRFRWLPVLFVIMILVMSVLILLYVSK